MPSVPQARASYGPRLLLQLRPELRSEGHGLLQGWEVMVGEMPSGSLVRSALPSPGHGSRGPVAHRTVMNAESSQQSVQRGPFMPSFVSVALGSRAIDGM